MDKCVGKMSVSSPDSGCMVLGCVLADGASRQPPLGCGPPLHGQGHRIDSQRARREYIHVYKASSTGNRSCYWGGLCPQPVKSMHKKNTPGNICQVFWLTVGYRSPDTTNEK